MFSAYNNVYYNYPNAFDFPPVSAVIFAPCIIVVIINNYFYVHSFIIIILFSHTSFNYNY